MFLHAIQLVFITKQKKKRNTNNDRNLSSGQEADQTRAKRDQISAEEEEGMTGHRLSTKSLLHVNTRPC